MNLTIQKKEVKIEKILLLAYNIEKKEVGGPLYKLLLKKEKAHGMDINYVPWSPEVTFLETTLMESH